MEVWRAILTELSGARDATGYLEFEGGSGPYRGDPGAGGGGHEDGDGGSGLYDGVKHMEGGWGVVMLKVAK